MVAAFKVPMLKPENGATLPKTQVVEGVTTQLLKAIEKRFGGNAATKKTQRNLLKQQYEKFTALSSEMLDQTFDRHQKLVSQLELLEENLSQEDVNQKLFISLSPEWNTHVVVWINKDDLDTMSMDDLYNNLKVYKPEVKGMSSSSSSTQNMAFVSSLNNNTSNTNEVVNTAQAVNTALIEFLLLAPNQPNSPQLVCEDLEQIYLDDMEEMDLRWQMAILTMRARRAPKNQDNKHKESSRMSVPIETSTTTALVSYDGLGGYEGSDQAEERLNYAFMAFASSSFDSENINFKFDESIWVSCYILNTIDHLGKFDGKADEGFFVRYSLNSKAFRVFNGRTRTVEENLHIRFSKNTPNVVGTKASDNACQARKETEPVKDYILLPLWTVDPPFPQVPKSSCDDGSKPSSDDGKKVDEYLRKENNELPFDPNMPALEDVTTFNILSDDEDDGAMAEMNNLDTTIQELCNAFEKLMHEKFQMRYMGELTLFLGLQVKQEKDGTFISQDKYIAKILKKFRFTEVKTASTPMETQNPLHKDEDGEEIDVHMYRSMIGSLMYLTFSRPDIMFAVCACARYQINPGELHAQVDGKVIVTTESSVRIDLQLADEEGIDCFPDSTIFEQLAMIGLGKGFSGRVTPLFQTMVVQNQSQLGEGFTMPTDPHHTPTILQPSSSQPQKTQKPRKLKRKDTQVPQPSGPSDNVADDAAHKELGGNTLQSDEDRFKLDKLMELCTILQNKVLDLEKTKTTQRNEIDSLKRRVKKLEKRNKSRTHKLKILYKVVRWCLLKDNVVEEVVDATQVSTAATTVTITTKEITLAQALEALKTSNPKVKRNVFQEPRKSTTTTRTISSQQSQDKCKGIMIEEPVKPKKKDQISLIKKLL
nr:hypothetical protein [Tanacetum cinerariifolium]